MLTRTLLSSPLLVASIGLAPHLTGCLDTTIVGGEGGGGGGDSSVTVGTSTPTGGAGGATSASAWLGAALDDATRSTLCWSGPCQADDTLFLLIDAKGSSCADPFVSEISTSATSFPESTWVLAIGIPPADQEVGVHAIDESFFMSSGETQAGAPGPSGVIASGGAAWTGGEIEILELTDTTVRFVARGLDRPIDGVELTAPRCGVTTLPPEGIALAGDAIGGGGDGGGDGGGAAASDDGITLVTGSALAACTDGLATTCEGDTWQVAVSLPADYVTPGIYALTDPRISLVNCTAQPKFLGGTIEVVDVDDDGVIVRFADVVDHELELEQDLRIARCP